MAQLDDNEERMSWLSGLLPSVRRQNSMDIMLMALVVVLGTTAIVGTLFHQPSYIVQLAVLGLVAVSFGGLYMRIVSRPDHVRALQSDAMLRIANESVAYLRHGLDTETADAVCRIVLRESEAAAAAITDGDRVLGFAGVGEEHHRVGGPIITRATMEALEENEPRILYSKDEIGCPEPACRLRAAIVVPLEKRGNAVGTLKFYYTSGRYLNETQFAMAEGLARLLSTQLELSELEAQTELAHEMELKALQAQINPHFLFNTINTIAAFIRTDPTEAHRLLRQFGSFYRRTLEHADELVTVERELEYVDNYIELEKARFGDRLVVVKEIDSRALSIPMPAFLLQPLVENAVGHGMRGDGSPLTITLSATLEPDALCVTVSDDGAGIPADRLEQIFEVASSKGLGIALRNVRDRVRGYFGDDSTLEIRSTEGVGTAVHITIRPIPGGAV